MPTKPKAPTSQFVCSVCGYTAPKWLGECPDCNNFNTMQEELVRTETQPLSARPNAPTRSKALPLSQIGFEKFDRVQSGIDEFDTVLGGGIVIKSHANGAYATDGFSAAILKNIFDKAGVKHQTYFNRSDLRSGSTLGVCALTRLGMQGADIGLAQLAMHSACESFAQCDYAELTNGLTAFYSSNLLWEDDACIVQ